MRSLSEIGGKHARAARLWLLVGWIAGCTVGDPDDIDDFDFDGSFDEDGGRRDAASRDTGTDDEDGGSTTPPKDAGSQPGTGPRVEDLPRLIAGASCDALEQCFGSAALLADVLGGRDCTELNMNLLLASPMRYLPSSVEAKLVVYDAGEVDDCLEDVRALGCAARSSRLPASCELMLLGTVATNGDCTINQDCAGDAYCDLGAMPSCPGSCAPLQAEGMPCNRNDDDQCDDGLVCFRGSCEKLGANGDDCSDTLPRCSPGLVCVGGECTSVPVYYFRKLDEACTIGVELCEPGLVCESAMGTMGVCKRTVAEDAPCKRSDPNQCPLDQYCDATAPGMAGTCRDRPGEGVACLVNRAQNCADAHVCIDGTCRALLQVGAVCEEDAQCYSGLCGDDAKCAAPLKCPAP